MLFPDTPAHEVVEIAKSPGHQTKPSHAEERVENLRIYLDPDLSCTAIGVAGRIAHRWCGIEEDEEDHGSPANNVQAIDCDEEAKGCQNESPECFAANGDRLRPGMFLREAVAVWVCAGLIWS